MEAKRLPVGGRIQLLKEVLQALPIYHMYLFLIPAKRLQIIKQNQKKLMRGQQCWEESSYKRMGENMHWKKTKGYRFEAQFLQLNLALGPKLFWRLYNKKT